MKNIEMSLTNFYEQNAKLLRFCRPVIINVKCQSASDGVYWPKIYYLPKPS